MDKDLSGLKRKFTLEFMVFRQVLFQQLIDVPFSGLVLVQINFRSTHSHAADGFDSLACAQQPQRINLHLGRWYFGHNSALLIINEDIRKGRHVPGRQFRTSDGDFDAKGPGQFRRNPVLEIGQQVLSPETPTRMREYRRRPMAESQPHQALRRMNSLLI